MAQVTINVQLTFNVEENPRIPLEAVKSALVVDVNECLASDVDDIFYGIYGVNDCTVTVSDKEDTRIPIKLVDTSVVP